MFNLTGCIKSDYKTHSVVGKEYNTTWLGMAKYPNCTLPWQQSMLGMHWSPTFNHNELTACNSTELSTLYSLDYEYLKVAARLNNIYCKGT